MLHIVAIGRLRDGSEATLFARYAGRIRPRLTLTELAEARGTPPEMRRKEATALLGAVPAGARIVALDLGGTAHGSEAFAQMLQGWIDSGRAVCFLIGGAEGLDAGVLARAEATLSLGPLTWPHLLVRVMLAEQLYRARAIATGHPYHRAARP